MVKPLSARANAKPTLDQDKLEKLTTELVDRPFGGEVSQKENSLVLEVKSEASAPEQKTEKPARVKRRSITISLPESQIVALEYAAVENKYAAGNEPSTVSAIISKALTDAGYKP